MLKEILVYYGVAFGALIALLIASSVLWNRYYRPRQIARSNPTPMFGNLMNRTMRFILKEDVQGKSFFTKWRNLYALLLIVSLALVYFNPLVSASIFGVLVIIAGTRARRVFSARTKILTRIYAVAHTEMKFARETQLNPWAVIAIQEWEDFTKPGKMRVYFPPSFKVSDPIRRSAFETHFDGAVAKDNIWRYDWDGTEGYVECAPVAHLPTMAKYPGSEHRKWNEIPLGVSIEGEEIWDVTANPHALVCGTTGGGKSVMQQNIIFHCIQHSEHWRVLGVDLKRVELDQFAKYDDVVLGIGKDLHDGVEIMRFARDEMMNRFERLEELGISNFMKMPSNERPPALLVMIDEAYMFMATTGGKTDQQKEEDELHGEATVIIGEIARLGRAAGVYLILATQRPDASVIHGEIRSNLPVRYLAGRARDNAASTMILGTDTGLRVPGDIPGRGVLSINGEECFLQGYFAESGWIDEWLDEHNPDDTDPTPTENGLSKEQTPDLANEEPSHSPPEMVPTPNPESQNTSGDRPNITGGKLKKPDTLTWQDELDDVINDYDPAVDEALVKGTPLPPSPPIQNDEQTEEPLQLAPLQEDNTQQLTVDEDESDEQVGFTMMPRTTPSPSPAPMVDPFLDMNDASSVDVEKSEKGNLESQGLKPAVSSPSELPPRPKGLPALPKLPPKTGNNTEADVTVKKNDSVEQEKVTVPELPPLPSRLR